MFKIIENPAACEMRSVIRFLNAKNVTLAEIHPQLCDLYGEFTVLAPYNAAPQTATNHIQQYQRSTSRAVTHVLVSWRWA